MALRVSQGGQEMIKAIPAEYKNEPYPSRLEAKWAVFFDHINLSVHHEYQGFDLDGLWYLPDFYIPKWKCYFEAKDPGIWENENRLEAEFPRVKEKALRLRKKTNHMVITCFGGFGNKPGSDVMFVLFPGYSPDVLGFGVQGRGTFGTCNGVDVLYLESLEYAPEVIAAINLIAGRLPEKRIRETTEALVPSDERGFFEEWLGGLSKEERIAQAEKILELQEPEYSRRFLFPLHSSVGFNFAMIKDEKQDCRIFSPFSDPLLCSFNAPYFDRFKPYTEAYKAAKQMRFGRKNGKISSNVL